MNTDMEQNDSLDKSQEPVLSITQFSFTWFFSFSFCIVHIKYLETYIPTNQKVFVTYSAG